MPTSGFTADRQSAPSNSDPWAFTLTLQQAVSFNELIGKANLGGDLVVPSLSWLPVITLTTLEGSLVPANGIYKVSGSVTADWHIPLLTIQLPMLGIGGTVDVRQKPGGDSTNYKKGTIFGTLNVASLQAQLALQLGTTGIDTLFTATLTPQQAQGTNLVQLANSLVCVFNGYGN